MTRFGRSSSLVVLVVLLSCLCGTVHAQNGALLGQSISWRPVNSPFTPNASQGAIAGGPGNDPNPGTPMYICRARMQGSLTPGKWVQGNCNVAFGGSEQIAHSYEVAYGSARWGGYRGSFYGLAQTGRDVDGSPLYSCRVNYADANGTSYGYQPGKLVANGTCNIPFGGTEVIQQPPFEVLYANGGGRPPWNPGYAPYPPYPTPPAQQPYPACKLGDPGVGLDMNTQSWAGPNCSSVDSQGRITQLKYPQPPGYTPPPQGPPAYTPGPSSVTWSPAQKPFVPGADAIKGGPGKGPQPGAPLFVCRVQFQNNLYPGKWMGGECHFADGQHELSQDNYEVATGSAEWRPFDGNLGAMVPGGYTADGTQLYICRKDLGKDKGLQPGWLGNGKCHIAYNYDTVSSLPFEALYNASPANGRPASPNQGSTDESQAHGVSITFGSGTGATAGMVTVANGSTETTVNKPLPPNSSAQQCLEILQQAALQAGLQIQQVDRSGLKVFGTNNAIHVSQAETTVTQF